MNSSDRYATTAVDYDPFEQAPLARVVPATEAQREIWLAAKLEPAASLAYNESVTLHLKGTLDNAALHTALRALVARHEALRGSLSPDGADFCIAERVDLPYAERDLAGLAPPARAAEVAATLRRVVETPFDLEQGPLVNAELLRLGVDEHLLVLDAHHIVCDGWSFGVLARELAALYAGARGGAAPPLAPADSFAEFALAEAARPGSEACRADEAYWLARFAELPPPLELPLDRARPRRRTFASRREDVLLDSDLIGALRRAGAQRGASLYATLLAGFGVLLERLCGQDDFVVGIPAAGQAAAGQQALVGHAVNVLPLRLRLDAALPFAELLAQVRSDLLDAFEHQQYTFGTLLKRLALARDPARLPLVGVLFNLDQALDPRSLAFGGLDFEFAGVPRRYENFELFINAVQVGGALRLECQYNSDLFDRATVARWLDAYATLLGAIAAEPQRTLAALPLLSAREAAALHALQPRPTEIAAAPRVEALVLAQAARTPARIALRSGGLAWSYAELAARTRQIAAALRARGIGDGALVGLALERGPDLVAAALGVLAAGAGYVPLDPAFPRNRLAFMAADAKLALLLTQAELAGLLDWPEDRTLRLDPAIAPAAAVAAPEPVGDGDAVAYVIYTSGSTGQPKGVRVPHRAVVNFLASMREEPGFAGDDRLLAVTTLSFDIAVLELFLPLSVGAEVILASRSEAGDGHALAALIERHAVSVMQATPATWRLLLEADWPGRPGFCALCGGEALPLDLAQALLARCDALWNLYGPTETTVWSTCWRVAQPEHGISIGRPIANTTVWILDAAGQACPIGVPGEIAIGGAGVTLGYLDRPQLTAERFIADPFSDLPGARLYRTGDRGRWCNDGRLEHLGRLDFQVKLRGYRIELGEVETALAAHPAVARALALVREDHPGDQRLVAYLALRPGAAVDAAALRAHLRTTLPEYMLPQHFVMLDAIPLLPNGKIDRKALPPPLAPVDAPARVAPRTELERRIAAAMEATLALPGLGVDDDFFALGGHSLLAAQLTARLSHEFGIALSLRTLFDAPTIAGLAGVITTHDGATTAPRIERRADQRHAPLSLQQTRLWLFEQLNPGSLVYNTPSAHRLRGALDQAAFERAFRALLERQAALRTSIGHKDGEPVQVIHDEVALELFPAEDLSALPPAAREAELMRRLDELTNRPFDLTAAPLFRVRMFRLAADEHVLFFMPHHIIWDGWSFDLFYEEFAALYAAFQAGRASPLPPLPVSYGDFTAWHAQWLEGPEYAAQLQGQLAAWRERLATHGAPRRLPTDRPRKPGLTVAGAGDTEWIHVSKAHTEALRELGRRAEATLFMALLAVYYALLYRVVGDGHLVVGTPARVRGAAEVEKIMGLFTNMLPLPLDLDPAASFLDLVAQVKRTVLDSFANPEVQLDDLLREPDLRAAVGTTDLYQAQFSYQDARQRIVDWGGLAQQQIPIFQRGASEDLAVWFLEHADGMVGGTVYNTDTLDAATAQRLAADYLALLERALADPQQSIANLVEARADIEQIRRWNQPLAEPPAAPLHALFEAAAARAPQRTALTVGSWGTAYGELEQRANRLAACLRRRGAGAGGVVALAAEPGANRVAALLGILKAGAACLPLDPADPPARLKRQLADAGATLLVGDSLLETALGWPRARALWFDLDTTELIAADGERGTAAPDLDAPAFALSTPDAAGAPRTLLFAHRTVAALLAALRRALDLRADERILGAASLDSGLALLESLLALTAGNEFVQASREEAAEAPALARLLAASGACVLFAPADTWRGLRAVDATANPQARAVCFGGAPEPALAAWLRARYRGLWNALATETALIASCGAAASATDDRVVGAPLGTCPLWVLDAAGRPLPVGASGEICVGLTAQASGRAAPPAAVDTPAAAAGERLVRSGYRGRWRAGGQLEELGRLDRRLYLGGRLVEPAEIEAVLRAQAGVARAAVAVRAADSGPAVLAAAVTAVAGAPLDPLALRAALRAELPDAAIPAQIAVLDRWPGTAGGEVDGATLLAAVDAAAAPADAVSDQPVTAAERLLAGLWVELIGVPRVGLRDNFFDLGGHSLLAMEMITQVEKRTRVRLNLLRIANSTLRALAAELPPTIEPAAAPAASTLGRRMRRLFGLRG